MNSTGTTSPAQAQLPKLVKRDAFTISHKGSLVGVDLFRDYLTFLVETTELSRPRP